jgi:hypothetical protein
MLLDVIDRDGAPPRFRYRRAGAVFWRDAGREPTGGFVDEVLPATVGYRDYVAAVYGEVVARRRPVYTENDFAIDDNTAPLRAARLVLPLSEDDRLVSMILTGHLFDHPELGLEAAFSRVAGFKEIVHAALEDTGGQQGAGARGVAMTLRPGDMLPPCDPRIAELHRHWLSLHPAPNVLPGRQHFDPARVRDLLPWLLLLDVQREPLRLKYRLLGTEHVRMLGCDPTGKWLDEVHPVDMDSPFFSLLAAAVSTGAVGYYKSPADVFAGKLHVLIEWLVVPLARNGRDVDMLLMIAPTSLGRPISAP